MLLRFEQLSFDQWCELYDVRWSLRLDESTRQHFVDVWGVHTFIGSAPVHAYRTYPEFSPMATEEAATVLARRVFKEEMQRSLQCQGRLTEYVRR